jgi:hypothetical protein
VGLSEWRKDAGGVVVDWNIASRIGVWKASSFRLGINWWMLDGWLGGNGTRKGSDRAAYGLEKKCCIHTGCVMWGKFMFKGGANISLLFNTLCARLNQDTMQLHVPGKQLGVFGIDRTSRNGVNPGQCQVGALSDSIGWAVEDLHWTSLMERSQCWFSIVSQDHKPPRQYLFVCHCL